MANAVANTSQRRACEEAGLGSAMRSLVMYKRIWRKIEGLR
jgi:hypothetical protein